jgi:coenzyme PQQ precursor peptide PqqA
MTYPERLYECLDFRQRKRGVICGFPSDNKGSFTGISLALITLMNTENNWSKPELEEIPLSCEVTSYSNAELPEESPIL